MDVFVQVVVITLRFALPLFMLVFPFHAVWINYVLDVVDGDILTQFGINELTYQTIDKVADYFSYIFMLILGLRWRIRGTIIVLFVYRTIGQALFFITRNELAFVYFQNFLEPLVMIYTLFLLKQGSEEKAFRTYRHYFILIWVIILAYKLWNEWYLHFVNIDLSTVLFNFNGGS